MGKLSMNCETLFKRYGAYEAGRLIKAAGFDAVDFSFMGMVNEDNPFLNDDYLQQAYSIKADFDRAGIIVNQAHAPFSFPLEKYIDKEALENLIFPRTIRSIEMAAVLGAETIIVHPIHYKWIGKEKAFEKNMEYYNYLIPYAKKFGIKIAVENMWDRDARRWCFIHDTCSKKEEFVSYIDSLNSESIVACLDIGHVGLPLQEDEAHDFIYALGNNRLKALHIHDNSYRGDEHMMPFMGDVNWDAVGKALGEIGYDGYFTYEVDEKLFRSAPNCVIPSVLNMFYNVLKYISDVADKHRV